VTYRREKLLIIDSDEKLLGLLETRLRGRGFAVITATEGRQGLRQLYQDRPDLVILETTLPGMDGWEVCERIRTLSDVPIILLTAIEQEEACVRGLRMGADDCVRKPFSLPELAERVEAVLRRSRSASKERNAEVSYADDYLVIDAEQGAVWCDGERVSLTALEQRLLSYMLSNQGRVLTARQILCNVWGYEYADEMNYVRLYIWRLRQKIEPDPKNPRYVVTEHGLGYRFAAIS
jgi:two-component system KDP operon response regulator KdpE